MIIHAEKHHAEHLVTLTWTQVQIRQMVRAELAYPVLSSSCLASLSLQANSSLKAVSCWVLKDFFCFLCTSRYDSSVNIGFMYFCTAGGRWHKGKRIKQELWHDWERRVQCNSLKVDVQLQDVSTGLCKPSGKCLCFCPRRSSGGRAGRG